MSYFRLINLIIEKKRNRFITNLKKFEEKNIKDNKFSKEGLKKFNENTSRLVSLLDLSKNRNKFAQPTFIEKEILVNEVESEEIIKNEIKDLKENIKKLDENIKKEINFDFKNQKELILYIKNNENIEKKIKKLNKILEKEITKKDN